MGSYGGVRPDARGNRDSYRYAFAASRSYASRVRYRSRSTRAVSQPSGVGVLRLSDPRDIAESRPPSFGDLRPKSLQTRRSRRTLAGMRALTRRSSRLLIVITGRKSRSARESL